MNIIVLYHQPVVPLSHHYLRAPFHPLVHHSRTPDFWPQIYRPVEKLRFSGLRRFIGIAAFCFIIVRFQDVGVIGKRKIPCLFICIYIPHQRQRSFLFFPHRVLGVLLRLVWGQRYCRTSLFLQVWEDLRAFRKWESISLCLSGSVGIQGHAVAEAPTGVARALLYIVRGSPSFLLSFLIHHQSYKLFYHTFHHIAS